MGFNADLPETPKTSAPVTPESKEVKAAGQQELDALRQKQGRGSTFFTNPAMQSGFVGSSYGTNTGSV